VALEPFQRVLDAHADTVLRYLTAALGAHDAEDAFQETFLAALRAYPRLRTSSDVRAWLLTIARNKALDAHRTRQRRPIPVETLPERSITSPDEALDDLSAISAVKSSRAREVLLLRYAADLSHKEIARILGTTEAASRRAAADGLRTLRHQLDPPSRDAQGPAARS